MSTPCSLQSAALGEQLAGTAPVNRSWIVVEHNGPWGRDALADSDLPAAVRTSLSSAKAHGVGVLLARRPDRSAAVPSSPGHHVWIARSAAGGMLLREAVLPTLDEISDWDMAAIGAGVLPGVGSVSQEPLLLVCTHSRRDQCCAQHGRALLAGLLEQETPLRTRIWECSHIGGHRFAPVTLSLPAGIVHGRMSIQEGVRSLALLGQGRVLPDRMRGRSSLPEPLQSAEVAVRQAAGIDGIDDLDVLLVHDDRAVPVAWGWAVPMGTVELEVRHADGRAWRTVVESRRSDAVRSESCGKDPVPIHEWVTSGVAPAPNWS